MRKLIRGRNEKINKGINEGMRGRISERITEVKGK